MTAATMTKTRRTRKPKADAEIRVRIDSKTKGKAARLFKRHGLSTSDGMRRLIDSVIADDDPWFACRMSSHTPNAETEAVLGDALAGRNMEAMTLGEFSKFLDEA